MVAARVSLAGAVMVLVIGWGASAHADPAKATAFFDRGTRLYEVGDYAQAIEQFKAGHIEEPDPSFVFNIAQCHRQLGHAKEALIGYRRFLAMDPDTSLRADVERKIAALEEEVKAAAPAPAPLVSSARLPSDTDAAAHPAAATNLVATPSPSPNLVARPPRWRWPLLVGGAATVLLAGSATALAITTRSRFDELRASCGQESKSPLGCPEGDKNGIRTRALATNVLWVLTGLAAVGTGIGVYVSRERSTVSLSLSF